MTIYCIITPGALIVVPLCGAHDEHFTPNKQTMSQDSRRERKLLESHDNSTESPPECKKLVQNFKYKSENVGVYVV